MRIAEVTRQTLPDLERGLRALARDLGDPYRLGSETLAHALFSEQPSCHALLATDAEEMTGIALYSPVMSTLSGGPGAYVSDLWIAPPARGAGLGASLIAAVARTARRRWRAGFLKLAAYDENPRSVAFYRRLGFETQTGESVMRLSGSGFDKLSRSQ